MSVMVSQTDILIGHMFVTVALMVVKSQLETNPKIVFLFLEILFCFQKKHILIDQRRDIIKCKIEKSPTVTAINK